MSVRQYYLSIDSGQLGNTSSNNNDPLRYPDNLLDEIDVTYKRQTPLVGLSSFTEHENTRILFEKAGISGYWLAGGNCLYNSFSTFTGGNSLTVRLIKDYFELRYKSAPSLSSTVYGLPLQQQDRIIFECTNEDNDNKYSVTQSLVSSEGYNLLTECVSVESSVSPAEKYLQAAHNEDGTCNPSLSLDEVAVTQRLQKTAKQSVKSKSDIGDRQPELPSIRDKIIEPVKVGETCGNDKREIEMHLHTAGDRFSSCIGKYLWVEEFARINSKCRKNIKCLLAILESLEGLESFIPEGGLVVKIENKWVVEYWNSRTEADEFCANIVQQILIWCTKHKVKISVQQIKPEDNRAGDSLSSSPPPKLPLGLSLIMYTDATPSRFSYYIGNVITYVGKFEFTDQELKDYGNNTDYLESLTIFKCLELPGVGQLLSGKSLDVRSDNLSTVEYINNGGSPKEHKDNPNDHKDSPKKHRYNITKQILRFCGDHNIKLTAQHVNRENNKVADTLSKLPAGFFSLKLPPKLYDTIKEKLCDNGRKLIECGQNIELNDFSLKNVTYKEGRQTYHIKSEDLLSITWFGQPIVFLPFKDTEKILGQINSLRKTKNVVLVFHDWPSMPWYKELRQLIGNHRPDSLLPYSLQEYGVYTVESVLNLSIVFLPSHKNT